MCYRYSVPGSDVLEKRFSAVFDKNERFDRRYHTSAFDSPKLPVITNEKPEQIQLFHWGLIPVWVKNKNNADEIRTKTANARGESIFEKPSFRNSAGKKHCLILSDGFFEWQYFQGRNYPYYIQLKDHEPFAMAGLWECWTDKETGEEINTYTIITTDANPLMAKIHNKKKRMPVILRTEDERIWISDNIDKDLSMSLIKPFDQNKMEAHTISRLLISKEENPDTSQVIEPYEYKELDSSFGQSSLF